MLFLLIRSSRRIKRRCAMRRQIGVLVLVFLTLLVAAACGPQVVTNPVEMPVVPTQIVEMPYAAAATKAPATAEPFSTAAPVDESAPGGASQLAYAPAGSRLVIKDATLELLVGDTDVALARVTQFTADVGGYIISSQTWYTSGFKFAELRLGIPSAEFERALNQLRGLAIQVVSENASGQDVSAEYVDLQSRLTNLEATAARVREFLQDAKTVEESLRISQQLAELEAQIEQVKGQMRFYEGRSAFSTVTVRITPQYPTPTPTLTPTPTQTPTPTPTFTPTPAWNPGSTFGQASGVLIDMTQFTVDAAIWIAVVGGPFILLGGIAIVILRRMKKAG